MAGFRVPPPLLDPVHDHDHFGRQQLQVGLGGAQVFPCQEGVRQCPFVVETSLGILVQAAHDQALNVAEHVGLSGLSVLDLRLADLHLDELMSPEHVGHLVTGTEKLRPREHLKEEAAERPDVDLLLGQRRRRRQHRGHRGGPLGRPRGHRVRRQSRPRPTPSPICSTERVVGGVGKRPPPGKRCIGGRDHDGVTSAD